MRIIIPFAILIIASVFLIKCTSKKANQDNKTEVNDRIVSQVLHFPESGEDTLKTSYFADTVIYVPLETTKESYIESIYQLWMNDSIILINNFGGGLLMFQQNGKFIKQIGKQGRGPGEYGKYIYHFDVIRDTIYISSTVRRGFLRYTFDGTFCDEIKLNYEPDYFSTTVDQKLVCFVHEEGKVFVYNNLYTHPDTITVEYGVTIGRYRYMVYLLEGYNYLQKTQTGLLFNSFLSDTVWNITGDKKEPAFILNMKDKLLPYDRQIEFSKGDFEWYQKMANPYSFVHLIPFPSMTFIFQFHHTIYADDSGYDAIYLNNTKTGELKKFSTSYIYDDIVSKQKLSNERHTYFYPIYPEDYLVTTKKPLDVLKYLEQNKENSKEVPSLSWLNQMKTLKEDDNPVLVLIKIKK